MGKQMHKSPINKLSFTNAIKEVAKGKKIKRLAWPEGEWGYLDGFLMIHKNGDFKWNISDGDMLNDDWISF
jgi:hypothetical protein